MLLNSISPKNIFSFGDDQAPIELTQTNILVGPNGSGKTSLIECLSLLQSAPRSLPAPDEDWLWKGGKETPTARIETVIANPAGPKNLRHWMEFSASENRFGLSDERIENEQPDPGHPKPYFYFAYQNGWPVINVKSGRRQLRRDGINTEQSILSQRKDPDAYPEISWLGELYDKIRIYRDWNVGRQSPLRQPPRPDLPDDFLSESLENLGAILGKLGSQTEVKQKILRHLRQHSPEVEDFEASPATHVLIRESGCAIPASRLSGGTLRFLCLLAILCHPSPPPLICIEEPELGLHPNALPDLADLLIEASARTQLIVTTHSDLLVEAFIDTPESVITFEKAGGKTQTRRLDAEALENWLDRFTLGPE